MGNRKTLYLIHHSHTDVGYTEPQGRVARWHADFIRQALAIQCAEKARPDEWFSGFRWTCETFWGVERFLESASDVERAAFADAVREGSVGLSASYLNLNELPDLDLLRAITRRAANYGESIGFPIRSAMTADVNGYSWGFAQALLDCGVANLFTCIHTHHGMYPLGRTQVPFLWEAPAGGKLLVWSGEHYHFGNELGIVPGAVSSYLTKDECDAEMIFGDHWGVAEIRIPRYWEKLEAGGYPFDFAPVMASGLRTDNAPPSDAIIDFVRRWNREHGDVHSIEMTTLDGFFDRLRKEEPDLPIYRGDWPDWWSDGPASFPDSTRLFREAQRRLRLYESLRDRFPEVPDLPLDAVVSDLALYAEHTFSHSDSMGAPWHPLVNAISSRKKAFAARAHDRVNDLLDRAAESLGGARLRTNAPLAYRVVNPGRHPARDIVRLTVGHFEYHERSLDQGAAIRVVETGEVLVAQEEPVPRGADFCADLLVPAGGSYRLELVPGRQEVEEPVATAGQDGIRTPTTSIGWEAGPGIVRFDDPEWPRSLLRSDRLHAPFSPVHEITPVSDRARICAVRGEMGLDRKGPDVVRRQARLVRVTRTCSGPVFALAELEFQGPGLGHCTIELRAHRWVRRVDVAVRMLKEARWEPENVYLPLPFTPHRSKRELWTDKAGRVLRPRRDQIPGTLTDYTSIQEGAVLVGEDMVVAIATPDAHLLQLGPLEPGPRRLAGESEIEGESEHLYSWVMNNFWETNFGASLGGFHEFRYRIAWGALPAPEEETAARICRDMNLGLFCIRLSE